MLLRVRRVRVWVLGLAGAMTHPARVGRMTVIEWGRVVVTLRCDCGNMVKRRTSAMKDANRRGRDSTCKACRKAHLKRVYPAPSVSLADAFSGLERMK